MNPRFFYFVPLLMSLAGCKSTPSTSGVQEAISYQRSDLSHFTCPNTAKVKVAFFDSDSTLRVSKSGSVSANSVDDVLLLPFVAQKIAALNKQNYLVAIVSNQGGVEAGVITLDVAKGGLETISNLIHQAGGRIDYIDFAEKKDELRKPDIGMAKKLVQAIRDRCGKEIDMEHSFMVGDSGYKKGKDGPHPDGRPADDFSNSDRLFAQNFFAPNGTLDANQFFEPTDYFGWKSFGVYNIENAGELDDFLITLEGQAATLAAGGNRAKAKALVEEVTLTRKVNHLERSYRFVHYNIKELTTTKLTDNNSEQVAAAAQTLRGLSPNLISINEMQYDLPGIPRPSSPGTGKNMERLIAKVDTQTGNWHYTFAEANTGKLAKKQQDGTYTENPNNSLGQSLADQVNFGTIPGQYSTGFATTYAIKEHWSNSALTWHEWDPSFDLAAHKLPNGDPLPAAMELFDKNFSDSLVEIDGKQVHVVTFHTVPAFDFGNGTDTNVLRNATQLEFLEWFLLGSCDTSSASTVKRCETSIKPLAPTDTFIAVGDFNVDVDSTNPGGDVIKCILTNPRVTNRRPYNADYRFLQNATDGVSHTTYMSDGVDLGKLQQNLDYFLVSSDINIEAMRVGAPDSDYKEESCHPNLQSAKTALNALSLPQDKSATVSTRYLANNQKSYCVISVSKEFAAFRKGSDHLPVYLTFKWKP